MKILKKSVFILLAVMILSGFVLPTTASANQQNSEIAFGAANVTTSGLRVRSGPSLDHSILKNLNRGSVVVILERTNSEWFRINFQGTVGFVNTAFLENVREAANFNARGRVTGSNVNVRQRPDINSSIVTRYPQNTTVNIVGINSGWYKINQNGLIGYIRSDLVQITSGAASSGGSSQNNSSSRGQQIANFAMQFRGYRYVWGGASRAGFDCSGLVTYVFRNFGISVSRTASAQFRNNGVQVSRSDLRPGDLVFFTARGGSTINHVGIYIGGGQFIHASSPSVGVIVSNLNGSHSDRWFGAKRLV